MKRSSLPPVFLLALLTLVPLPVRADDADAAPYAEGTRAINESRWSDAVRLFRQVAQMHGGHADAALYWEAYVENKDGQSENALNTCGELSKTYPHSKWLNECGALEIEIRGKSGAPQPPQAEADENLRLLALNALMQQDEEKAIPILEKVLAGNQSEKLKERTLFVLAQSQSPQAQKLVMQVAQGQSGPGLQVRAIRMIAAAQGKKADDSLAAIYQHSNDPQVKRVVLQSYLITGSSSKLLEIARQETNPELAKTAIQTLGAMGHSQDLQSLYHSSSNAEIKGDIIQAMMAGGQSAVAPLSEIAQSEPDAGLRRKAIRNLGVAGGSSVAPALVTIYQKNTDTETKHAAAQALFLANDARDLVSLARAEKDTELKEFLVQQLSLLHNDESTKYMMEILNR